ncbi:MBL fold metallo-hydrolase [Candidatus Amarobacter glycogenicus]|uniref:MBL fold metallo-hydrolase n=1 Tax=Candidatus Amarobacter glycogenicus TaxID=3140699 RepID=UPI0031360025|nr:MBL fold metallo-hydrolase [Dehalococcoidia bacterium]MBK8558625.1 MBL fold metallo-hydrolase [Dehalococcoidia bacterium]
MKLTVFRSEKGDCLLLTSKNGKRMLIDGGMEKSYENHVAPELGRLRDANKKVDLVYVSHIDRDHISGVLRMLDDEAAWRVHEFQVANGNPGHPIPQTPRPPKLGGIWHNAFRDQLGNLTERVEDTLAASAPLLLAADAAELRRDGSKQGLLAQSIPEALKVSRRIGPNQLDIALNKQFAGKLATVEGIAQAAKLGTVTLTVIGPFAADVTKLRAEWKAWLETHGEAVLAIQQRAAADEESMGSSALAWPASQLIALGNELGARSKVTTPNLASIMLLAEEGGRRVLLTGDGHWQDILHGLERRGKLDPAGKLHVEVLKVQHHGSEHNIEQQFCDAITADHYVFCANGEHANPDLRVVSLIAERRFAEGAGAPFTFWFNSHSSVAETAAGRAHMSEVETLVGQLEQQSGGRLRSESLLGDSFEVPV